MINLFPGEMLQFSSAVLLFLILLDSLDIFFANICSLFFICLQLFSSYGLFFCGNFTSNREWVGE